MPTRTKIAKIKFAFGMAIQPIGWCLAALTVVTAVLVICYLRLEVWLCGDADAR